MKRGLSRLSDIELGVTSGAKIVKGSLDAYALDAYAEVVALLTCQSLILPFHA